MGKRKERWHATAVCSIGKTRSRFLLVACCGGEFKEKLEGGRLSIGAAAAHGGLLGGRRTETAGKRNDGGGGSLGEEWRRKRG
jgi:hypothetical protein